MHVLVRCTEWEDELATCNFNCCQMNQFTFRMTAASMTHVERVNKDSVAKDKI